MIKFTIPIGQNYLFDFIAQSNYCTIEIFNRSYLKNNIEKKSSCKFDKIISENLWELHQACKYEHQIVIKEDVGWYGTANFAGTLFDSV